MGGRFRTLSARTRFLRRHAMTCLLRGQRLRHWHRRGKRTRPCPTRRRRATLLQATARAAAARGALQSRQHSRKELPATRLHCLGKMHGRRAFSPAPAVLGYLCPYSTQAPATSPARPNRPGTLCKACCCPAPHPRRPACHVVAHVRYRGRRRRRARHVGRGGRCARNGDSAALRAAMRRPVASLRSGDSVHGA